VLRYYTSVRDAERQRLLREEALRRERIKAADTERRAVIEAARARIPERAYEIPLGETALTPRVLAHLERAGLENVGQVMALLAEGDEGLLKLEGVGPKSLTEVKQGIEALGLAEVEMPPVIAEPVVEAEAAAPPVEAVEAEVEAVAVGEIAQPDETLTAPELEAQVEITAPAELAAVDLRVEAETPAAVTPEDLVEPTLEAKAVEVEEKEPPSTVVEETVAKEDEPAMPPTTVQEAPESFVEEEEDVEFKVEEDRKRDRLRRRRLVYDEDRGMVVAQRRRKRGEISDEPDEFSEWDNLLG
jgi:hypothetical protein